MATEEVGTAEAGSWPISNPWPALLYGVGATAAGLVWFMARGEAVPEVRALLLGSGLLAAGAAVAIRPRSSVVLALAALACLFGRFGMEDWDGIRIVPAVLAVVAAAAAVVVQLPQVWQRVVISLVILFHFGGILIAVTSAPPPPWITRYLWMTVYRPYLEFMYLNNAYHFYSPEPGPPFLLWFCIYYEDQNAGPAHGIGQTIGAQTAASVGPPLGPLMQTLAAAKISQLDAFTLRSSRWVKLPPWKDDREKELKDPLAVEFFRRLSLTESVSQIGPATGNPVEKERRREEAAAYSIPYHPHVPLLRQYQEPNPYSKRMTSEFAKHVAKHYPSKFNPELKVTGVRVYRVIQNLLMPKDLVDGTRPVDDWVFWPYYFGEFDVEGNLKNPNDPLLYWLIPIIKDMPVPIEGAPGQFRIRGTFRYEPRDYVEIHAGSKHAEEQTP